MPTAYQEFTCLGSNLLSTLQAAILASSDWVRPDSGGKPTLFKATTTRGAQMVVDTADVAVTVQVATFGVYRTHDGITGVDKISRYLYMKRVSAGTLAANTYRGVVSAGKEHLFVMIEGPRVGESSPDSVGYGSIRNYFFMSDIVPYFDSTIDKAAAVAVGGAITATPSAGTLGVNHHVTVASRNMADTASWSPGKLLTLNFPIHYLQDQPGWQVNGPDGNQYLSPYVFVSDSNGIRGRLSSFFFAGWNLVNTFETPGVVPGSIVTYGGKQYKLLAVSKSDGTTGNVWGQFGAVLNNTGGDAQRSPIVAVPYA